MDRRLRLPAFLLLAACTSKAQVAAVREISLPGKVCNAAPENIAFRPVNHSEYRRKYDPPKILLRRDAFTELVDATWEDDSQRLVFNVPAGLPRGNYSLAITNQGQTSAAELQGSLQIVVPPSVDKILQGLWCAEGGVESTLRFSVSGLEDDTAVILDGMSLGTAKTKLERHPDEGLVELHVLGGSFAAGTKFDLVVTNAPGCSARVVDGVAIVGPPQIDSFVVGPTLRDGSTTPPNTPFVARVGGTQVTQASLFLIDGVVAALSTKESPTSGFVDASFPAIAEGVHTLSVKNGGCGDDAATALTVSSALPITLRATNPSAITAATAHYLDVTTGFAAPADVASAPKFFVDIDPAPLSSEWRELPVELDLDGDRTLIRVRSPEFALLDSAALDLRVEADSVAAPGDKLEGFLSGGVYAIGTNDLGTQLPEDSAPRLVWKDRDHAMVGEHVVIYGCFDTSVSAELVAVDSPLGLTALSTYTTLLVRSNGAAEAWAAHRFRCLPSPTSQVTRMLDLEVPSDASPGAYRIRLRASRDDGAVVVADDFYPFVVYGASPTLAAFSFAEKPAGGVLELSVGRKLAASAVASDGNGRKYVYVLGGGRVTGGDPSSNAATAETASATYEFSPISSHHSLLGFVEKTGAGTDWPLLADASATPNLGKTYGMLALADGADVYLIGGTSDGTAAHTTGEVRRGVVTDSFTDPINAGQLGMFSKVGQLQTGTAVEVKSYGHSGAILRSSTAGTTQRTVVVVRGIEDSATPFVADQIVLSSLVDPSNGFSNLAVVAALESDARGRAFATTVSSSDALHAFCGYAAPVDDAVASSSLFGAASNRFHSRESITAGPATFARSAAALTGDLDHTAGASVAIALPEVGVAAALAGSSTFLLGGIHAGYNNGGAPDDNFAFAELRLGDPAEPTQRVRSLVADSVATSTVELTSRRAFASAVFLPPHLFLVSGLVCKSDEGASPGALCDQASDRGLSRRVEHTTIH